MVGKMKSKIIVIVYVGSLVGSVSATERMFAYLTSDLKSRGHIIKYSNNSKVIFEDGTKISKIRIGEPIGRATHVYIDDNILDIGNGVKFVNEAVIPSMIKGDKYKLLDAESDVYERITVFNSTETSKYEKE